MPLVLCLYIPQQLLDQIDVCEHHTSATVSVEAELVHRVAVRYRVAVLLDCANELDVALVEVCNDLGTITR